MTDASGKSSVLKAATASGAMRGSPEEATITGSTTTREMACALSAAAFEAAVQVDVDSVHRPFVHAAREASVAVLAEMLPWHVLAESEAFIATDELVGVAFHLEGPCDALWQVRFQPVPNALREPFVPNHQSCI